MNKRYIYSDGKVVVTDDAGISKEIEYSDNIEKILIKENVIEQMELEYKKLENELLKYSSNISFKLLSKSIFSLLSIPIILILMPLIFGAIKLSALPIIGCICAILVPTTLATFLIYQYNKNKNIKNTIKNQMTFLKQQLSVEKGNLKRLNDNKTNENELIMVPASKRVDDIMELKRLKKQLLSFYNYSYYQGNNKQKSIKKRLEISLPNSNK